MLLITYLVTCLLTSWSRVLREKLTGSQLAKKFPALHGTRRFITAFTSARHLSLSCASSYRTYLMVNVLTVYLYSRVSHFESRSRRRFSGHGFLCFLSYLLQPKCAIAPLLRQMVTSKPFIIQHSLHSMLQAYILTYLQYRKCSRLTPR